MSRSPKWLHNCLKEAVGKGARLQMNQELVGCEKPEGERAIMESYLKAPNEDSFAELFKTFSPRLVAFFRARRCELSLAEDLAQEVMLTVHRKAAQIRDRNLFRGWLFRVAHNALCRYYGQRKREVETVNVDELRGRFTGCANAGDGIPAFEFQHWMGFLDSQEREVMILRFIEQWEYHEIAAAQSIPIGTIQWRVFNAKRKLAPYLASRQDVARKAA